MAVFTEQGHKVLHHNVPPLYHVLPENWLIRWNSTAKNFSFTLNSIRNSYLQHRECDEGNALVEFSFKSTLYIWIP